MARKFIVLFLVLLAVPGFSQDSAKTFLHDSDDNSNGHGFAFSSGVSFQKQFMGEVGLMYYSVAAEGSCNPSVIVGPKVSSEFNFRFNNKFIAGPKISYEADLTIFGFRANLIDYTNFKQGDMCFTPEAGFTIAAYFDVFYGYNIPLSSNRTNIPGTNRITLTINILNNE